jgi:hypothetical protein
MEGVAAVLASLCAARFALLLWHGYRHGEVKSAAPWSSYYDRQTHRIVYRMFMGAHAFVLLVCVGAVVYIMVDLLRATR